MAHKRRTKRALRVLAAPFTVAPPTGARIRDRLRLSRTDESVLVALGRHLGALARADLAERVRIGMVPARQNRRAERKKALTKASSSRWAGAITRTSEDQYQLALRALFDERAMLTRAVRILQHRLAVPCGQRENGVRGYANRTERWHKRKRLDMLTARLAEVEHRIEAGHPAIVVGGKRLARMRHHLADARLTPEQWRQHWDAARLFLTADGESGASHGNYTVTVDPNDGTVTIALPEPLRHLANAPRGRYRLEAAVAFHHRHDEWADRVGAHRAVRYDLTCDSGCGRWYLDASWAMDTTMPHTPAEMVASGARLLGVDLNADHLAACVVDVHGNPVGQPLTVPVELTGSTSRRDGRLRAAITRLISLARAHGCAGLAIENLGFADARACGREMMGRGRRGKRFRRTVAGIPTARFRERLRGMAYHAGLVVVAVDPAYTSRWGGQHWKEPLQQRTSATVTGHHAASVAIGRRALGRGIRRRPRPRTRPEDRVRRVEGQTGSTPKARGATGPPRTAGTPPGGGKTRPRHGDQLVLFPDLQDRSGGHRARPVSCGSADTGQPP
ncbi:transposase [Nocardiopsis sp. HUAS JQ3]|uniref:transposase n=1 Tax=Nocardiopsis sp. HUAS JQ3 TaxID=3061629 RepID=UPI0023A991BA|nr:transposase [Nocardiopsis sp. HUAS JQ3]WDZ92307.1 transposase [Nocardiopsis sp. HUAS JQ3]